ncbi:tripartite tricarboxylate transporter TctB family protein [Chelatococcus sp. SYSU_G07232]|uniref:Tripartite tricarboxylate transporter TctB family protein n=1 Tax=Chelatococcus albus TaxID=3047466 RepID=A0ABT7AF25_9HYPH|nr:tripartite tricarboxylate transporter TctB family protein [Chelatococcus sp. SYSU_G07232]MDJ1157951.1 tripartite tricarboxylate transporter TctB family protein [Chelatococcus sp. SYSU_G07232]
MSEHPTGPTARSDEGSHAIRSPQNFAAGLSLVALMVFALWAGRDLDQGTLRAMGAGMLPRAIAVLIGLCGAALVAVSFVKDGDPLERWHLRGPFFVCLGILAFAFTIRSVGLAVAGPLVAIVSGVASPETRLRELLAFALVVTAFCIGLFRYVLNLPLPVLIIPPGVLPGLPAGLYL